MKATDLILNPDGSVYHLALRPDELAPTVLLVGDPDRVPKVSQHWDRVEVVRTKREFVIHTGWLGSQRLTCLSTGIGTDNIDIVLNELDALVNVDFSTRTVRPDLQQLTLIRIGTCGGLRAEVEVGTPVFSRYAVGAEGLMRAYRWSPSPETERLATALQQFVREHASLSPVSGMLYGASATLAKPTNLAVLEGITFTAAGFYGPQGRTVRTIPVMADLPGLMGAFSHNGIPVLNMEMETAGIFGLAELLGHRAASLSVILANRPRGIFHPDPHAAEAALIRMAMEWVEKGI